MREIKGGAIFNPSDFRAYLAGRRGKPESEISVPQDLVLTYDSRIFRSAIAGLSATQLEWYIYGDRMYVGTVGGEKVGIALAMMGAPAAAMNLEELISYGARRVYELGFAGAINATHEPGDVVVLKGAFSDEGTSRHYFREGRHFGSSRALTRQLAGSLREEKVEYVLGEAWTTDAPYRETRARVVRYRRMGASVVNMESSAVLAVAKYRGIEAASAQIVSDIVSEKRWDPAFHRDVVDKRRQEVLAAVFKSIRGEAEGRKTR